MADINFDCPHCEQNMDAPQHMAGWSLDCPSCGKKIRIPSPEGGPVADPVDLSASPDKASTGIIDEELDEDMKKGSTVRIEVPAEFLMPEPHQRIVKIKRSK